MLSAFPGSDIRTDRYEAGEVKIPRGSELVAAVQFSGLRKESPYESDIAGKRRRSRAFG
jgi:hypothetical protein